MYANVCKCMQMYANVCKCMQMYANVCKCMQMYANVCKCMQMYALQNKDYSTYSQIFNSSLWNQDYIPQESCEKNLWYCCPKYQLFRVAMGYCLIKLYDKVKKYEWEATKYYSFFTELEERVLQRVLQRVFQGDFGSFY